MRVVPGKPLRRQRQSFAGLLAVVLAIICLVQFHLLLKPGRRDVSLNGAAGGAGLPTGTQGMQQSQRQPQELIRTPSRGGRQPGTNTGDAAAGGTTDAAWGVPTTAAGASPKEAAVVGLERVRGAKLAFVSFANGAFLDFINNWVLSVQRLGVPYVVGALDEKMAEVAASRGWPHLLVGSAAAMVGGTNADPAFFRANFTAFRSMGAKKVQLVLTMLEDMKVQTISVSDSDTTWLRSPSDYLAQFPTVDVFMSTDCLSHKVEAAWQPRHNQPRCGHVAGNSWGRAFNTGIFFVRNTEAGKDLLRQWRDAMLDSEKTTITVVERATGKKRGLGITDQVAMNDLLEFNGFMPAAPENPRILLPTQDGKLRLHPLPVLLFASGHISFVQRLPWKYGVDPYIVHATFQRYPTNLHREGKRGRFREMGMWFLDDLNPEYYNPPGGARYLTYTNDVRRVVAAVEAERFNGAMPLLYKHMVGISYQLALFRDALAAATMLNRTIVLPKSWCWCDYDWTPHVLERCRIRGSDLHMPFECPSDFVFIIPYFDEEGLNYRMPGFLERPQVPEHVRRFHAELVMLPTRPARLPAAGSQSSTAAAAAAADPSLVGPGPQGVLWPEMSQQELMAAVQPLITSAVITINDLKPGLLVGFTDPQQTAAFDGLWDRITKDHGYWCCAAEIGGWTSFKYELPKAFQSGYNPWQPPIMEVPTWCNEIAANERQREYVFYANHPCQFLTNETAAAVAATLE